MQDRTNIFLIIGAGPCGLSHAKALKEAGIEYEQVEADDEVGGNWYQGTYGTAHISPSGKERRLKAGKGQHKRQRPFDLDVQVY